jgi:predicted RNA-binding Zn-ribbon protein involved in translation (DUF1610 family)
VNLFKKKKACVLCEGKIVAGENYAEIRYNYTDEDGVEGIGVAYACPKCVDEIGNSTELDWRRR